MVNEEPDAASKTRFTLCSIGLVVLAGALVLLLVAGIWPWLDNSTDSCGSRTDDREARETAETAAMRRFTKVTGIKCKRTFTLVGHSDTHSGWLGDGEFAAIVKATDGDMEAVLAAPPPWGNEWKQGPVDGDVGGPCNFIFRSSTPMTWRPGAVPEYSGGAREVRELLSGTDIRWCAKARGSASAPWQNADVLVIDRRKQKMWLSVRDF